MFLQSHPIIQIVLGTLLELFIIYANYNFNYLICEFTKFYIVGFEGNFRRYGFELMDEVTNFPHEIGG